MRWVKHAEEQRSLDVTYLQGKGSYGHFFLHDLPPVPDSDDRDCPSSVMPGIFLGLGPGEMARHNVATTWQECRDLCCLNHECVSWTLSLSSKTCYMRDKPAETIRRYGEVISGVTKSYVLPAPLPPNRLQFYIGVLSAPKNRDRVDICVDGLM